MRQSISLWAISLAIVAVAQLASPPALLAQDVDAATLADARRFRDGVGFRSDDAFLRALERDDSLDRSYGVPLTRRELLEMGRRNRLQDGLGPVVSYLERHPAKYGGIYLDQLDGASINVFWRGNTASALVALQRRAPAGATVRVRPAKHSLRELHALKDRISNDAERLSAHGIDLAWVAADPRVNRVVVAMVSWSTSRDRLLKNRYGDAVTTKEDARLEPLACVSRYNCASPMKGGLAVSGGGQTCTSGFMARHINNATPNFVLTAGHCIQNGGGVGVVWKHNGVTLGTSQWETYNNLSWADVGSIADVETGTKNLVFRSTTSFRSITSERPNNQQLVGYAVCRSGIQSEVDCGKISQVDYSPYVGAYQLRHQWEVDFGAVPGDSGAPFYYGNAAYGILSGATTTRSNYGTIENIRVYTEYRPCYTPSCG